MPDLTQAPGPLAEPPAADTGANGVARYRIAMLAPPWLPVPPPGYGGIEAVVALLCEGLVHRGHDVTLFAAPGSHSSATVRTVLPDCYPDRIERALHEVDHVARVFDAVDQAARGDRPFDIIHDHCGFTAFAMADRIATPLLHTLHGPFTAETSDFYRHHAAKAPAIAISSSQRDTAPPELQIAAVIPNPTDVRDWPYQKTKQDYLLWIGRMAETKGPHRAIAAARAAGVPLVLAGPVQPGQETFFREAVAPHLDGSSVTYVGEVGGDTKRQLFANARGLLMPISWPEPFGMVMIEALSCGTPVIAFAEGAAPEIVHDGVSGYLVADEAEMTAAITQLNRIDPAACRAQALTRFDIHQVAAAYEAAYHHVLTDRKPSPTAETAPLACHPQAA
jgi:glycosyltransferase involved in cell wall biosynthesis